MLKKIVLIVFGGFIGCIARYFISKLNLHFDYLSIPIDTLLVNILGNFLLAF